jgi:hypothetical protein
MKANKIIRTIYLLSLIASGLTGARAELVVKVDQPKLTGQKALVKLTMKNAFKEKVESARAQVFLTGRDGKVIGQAAHWVIGGSNDRPPLAPNAESTFNFVLTFHQSTNPLIQRSTASTNLTAKVTFNRLILEGGKLAEPGRDVVVVRAGPGH